MPIDQYFTRDGAKNFTCRGKPRMIYTAEEKAEAERLLKLPDGARASLDLDIFEKLIRHERVSRAQMRFHLLMKERARVRRHMPLILKHSDQHISSHANAHV